MESKLLKRIAQNASIVFFGNTSASILNFISFALMARLLGPEILAVFVLAQTYSLLINDIFNIQTWESLVKFGSNEYSNNTKNIIKTNVLLDSVSAVVAFVFALLLSYPISMLFGWGTENSQFLSLYSITILFNITTLTIGVPRLFNKFGVVAKIQICASVVKIIIVSIIYYTKGNLLSFIILYLFIDSLTNISLILYSTNLLKDKLGKSWWKLRVSIDIDQLRFIWWTNLRSIVRIPVRRFDVIVISSVMSLYTLGIYKIYKEITGIIERIGEPVNQAIYPEFTRLISKNKSNESINIAIKSIIAMSLVSAIVTLFLLGVSKPTVSYFFGVDYLGNITALYLMIIISGISFAILPINSLFTAAGFAKYGFYIVVCTNAVYLALAFYLGSIWGIYGVIFANLVQMLMNQGLKFVLLKKYSFGWSNIIR